MSCSMMFNKRFIQFIMIITGLLLSFTRAEADAESLFPVNEAIYDRKVQEADILLIYGSSLSDMEISSVEVIVKTITYLQGSITYIPYYEADSLVENYAYIICYNIGMDGTEFIQRLAGLDKNVFFLGGNAVISYIEEAGYPLTYEKIDEIPASMEYVFYGQEAYSDLERIEDTYFIYGDYSYQSGTIKYQGRNTAIYSSYDSFLYCPYIDMTGDILRASFAKEAAYWLWPYKGEPHAYSQYIVLDEVYPFYPPEQLLKIVDYMIEYRLPFVISVMTIYDNGDYPAMKRFCEVLAYAQVNGGAIIMHAPNLVYETEDTEQIWKYLTYAMEAYTNYGIYPLGIQVPESYLFDETGREILKRYSTVFCYRKNESASFDITDGYNYIYKDGHNLIAPSHSINQKENIQINTMPTAAYINITKDLKSVKEQINDCMTSEIPLNNLWELEQRVYADNIYLYSDKGNMYFKGEKINIKYEPFTYEPYEYKSGAYQWILMDLTGFNKQLAVIVVLSSGIFVSFIIIGRIRNRRRFLIPEKKEQNDGMD